MGSLITIYCKKRLEEHQRTTGGAVIAVGEHIQHHNHGIDMEHVQIVDREEHFWNRKIREVTEIQSQQPTLNRDLRYELAPIYDDLFTPECTTGSQVIREI